MSPTQAGGDPLFAECPGREIFNHLTSRWGFLVMLALAPRALRYFEIRNSIGGISDRMLSATLRTLVRDGFVERTVIPVVPPQVTYAMSPLGADIVPMLDSIRAWLGRRIDDVLVAQNSFDRSMTT